MRKIKFRGKLISDDFRSIYKDGWIYGDYLKNNISHFIIKKFYEEHDNSGYPSIDIKFWQKVIPETVGQFTGFYDNNGKEIYEGDILQNKIDGEILIVEFNKGTAQFTTKSSWLWSIVDTSKVIGNVHDNPELLEREGINI